MQAQKKKKSPSVVKLYDEQMLLEDLIDDTFALIKRAKNLDPIKKLIEIHDILSLNAALLEKFRTSNLTFDEIWLDAPTLKHINHLRCELMVYHNNDFASQQEIAVYNRTFCRFLNLVLLRLKNGFDFEISSTHAVVIRGRCS
jgi:hypothetical protein